MRAPQKGIIRPQIRPACFRGLRQGDQEGDLGGSQPVRRMSKPCPAGRCYTLQIAAIGGEGEVGFKDFILRITRFELQSPPDFHQLGARIALCPRLEQPSRLHSQRRGSRENFPGPERVETGAQDRQRVNAVMGPEARVLYGDQCRDESRVDSIQICRQPPASALDRKGTEYLPPGVGDDNRSPGELRWRKKTVQSRDQEHGGQCGGSRPAPGGQDMAHQRSRIMTSPAGVRAKTSVRYMSSTTTPGMVKRPGVTARTV